MMWRNLRGFMSLFHSEKPVVCKVHGFCVAGGTDMALCSDLIVAAEDAKIGYPPARVWGVPTSMLWAHRIGLERARRLLLTGDSITGALAAEWGLASAAVPAAELDAEFEDLLARVARVPINQLVMHKLAINQSLYAQGLHATQAMSVFFDGIARHTSEGFAFQQRAAEAGFREAVRERDEPFGDWGLESFRAELRSAPYEFPYAWHAGFARLQRRARAAQYIRVGLRRPRGFARDRASGPAPGARFAGRSRSRDRRRDRARR